VVGVVHAVNDGVAEVTAGLAQTTLFESTSSRSGSAG